MYWRVQAGRERALGPGYTHTLRSTINLGAVLCGERKYEAAEIMYRRTVMEGEKALGPSHRMTPKSANCREILLQARESRALDQAL
ncbi:hypothetical protein HOY80DRAFT_946475 [Tuber brumale]|nr:hypothetical protein HOY80DRAFT_946475 [Tuber brumale]